MILLSFLTMHYLSIYPSVPAGQSLRAELGGGPEQTVIWSSYHRGSARLPVWSGRQSAEHLISLILSPVGDEPPRRDTTISEILNTYTRKPQEIVYMKIDRSSEWAEKILS